MLRLAVLRRFSQSPAQVLDADYQEFLSLGTPLASIHRVSEEFYHAQLRFYSSLKQIPLGKANKGLVSDLTVYSFGEYVPLSLTADIKVISETELFVQALDYYNIAPIEVAIRRTGIQAEIVRDFDKLSIKLTGVVTDDLKARLTSLYESTQAELTQIKDKAVANLLNRDASQAEEVTKLFEGLTADITAAIESKLSQK